MTDPMHGWAYTFDCAECEETYWHSAPTTDRRCELCGGTLRLRGEAKPKDEWATLPLFAKKESYE